MLYFSSWFLKNTAFFLVISSIFFTTFRFVANFYRVNLACLGTLTHSSSHASFFPKYRKFYFFCQFLPEINGIPDIFSRFRFENSGMTAFLLVH